VSAFPLQRAWEVWSCRGNYDDKYSSVVSYAAIEVHCTEGVGFYPSHLSVVPMQAERRNSVSLQGVKRGGDNLSVSLRPKLIDKRVMLLGL
jgi:hypothetical protein